MPIEAKNVETNTEIDVIDIEGADLEQNDEAIGRAFWRSILVLVALACIAFGVFLIAKFNKKPIVEQRTKLEVPSYRSMAPTTELPQIPLVDITQSAGIDFVHANGKAGQRLLPETMGGSAGFIDYDNDSDSDIFFVNSCSWPWDNVDGPKPTMKLYRNDGTGKFDDVTKDVGLDQTFYGMGPAFGDYDGDGWTDIFVTAVGRNHLYRNLEGKKFEDVAESLGLAGDAEQWSCPSMWLDYDRDGKLDLMVGKYVNWNREADLQQGFTLSGIGRAYGQPTAFGGTYLSLYRNTGNGFEDVSEKAGLLIRDPNTNVPVAKSLGMALLDANYDGWLDIVVANDTVQNFLFVNQKDGTFQEIGYTAGVAVDRNGMSTGAMGVDVACFRNDDRQAIAIGNFANEPSSLYVARGKTPNFRDEASLTGFGPQTKLRLTFGLFFADMDLDGRLDMVCANGHLEDEISKFQSSQQYEQPPQLFWNAGADAPTELVELNETKTGNEFQRPFVGRAATYADIDNDGDIDVLFVGNGQRAFLYRNDQKLGNNWLRIKLKGQPGNTDAIGAKLLIQEGDTIYSRMVTPTRSYLSQCELPVTFGFGKNSPTKLIIEWPRGAKQEVKLDQLNQTLQIEEPAT